ncbi:heterotrimeric G-protein alpha subunit (G-alpha, GPA3) [Atractiella rhizophila]|nr:heterotrimeric G-protein alpha subunit (G-alpha, GPA3) [Atractiella rhizophila]
MGDAALKSRHATIEKRLAQDAKRQREVKILLLGAGESGKSTIVKQMKIIHQGGYNKQELMQARLSIYSNLLESAQAIVMALADLQLELQDPANKEYASQILSYRLISLDPPVRFPRRRLHRESDASDSSAEAREEPPLPHFDESVEHQEERSYLTPDIVRAIESVWHDPIIPLLLERGGYDWHMMDNAPHFLNRIKTIGQSDYVPSIEDVLKSRKKTTGLTETHFQSGRLIIHMVDVGGQRSERKKWINAFEDVTCIIFCVSLIEYDQVLREEARQNRLQESLDLFGMTIASRWFLRTAFMLFLNKSDLLPAKLKRAPFQSYFPSYDGGPKPGHVVNFLIDRFKELNVHHRDLQFRVTVATDSQDTKTVFTWVQDQLITRSFKESGLI